MRRRRIASASLSTHHIVDRGGEGELKNWLDRNGCNAINCNKLGEEVASLHCENCTSSKKTCGWDPYYLNLKNKDDVTHLELYL